MTNEQNDKCIVFGCSNKKHEGRFIGDICAPCYAMLKDGRFISQSKDSNTGAYKIPSYHDFRNNIIDEQLIKISENLLFIIYNIFTKMIKNSIN